VKKRASRLDQSLLEIPLRLQFPGPLEVIDRLFFFVLVHEGVAFGFNSWRTRSDQGGAGERIGWID
jgi:hypothetical protein